jgi:heme O synthase-like polyprenyltransferase
MLPSKTSPRKAAGWVMVHAVPAAIAGLALAALPFLGWSYLIPVSLVSIDLLWRATKLLIDPSPRNARKLFIASNIYLLVLLVAICIGSILPF